MRVGFASLSRPPLKISLRITALRCDGVDRLMLDNMVKVTATGVVDTSMLRQAVELIRGRIPTEASGNVTLQTVGAIAATGVDFISSGSLSHSVTALDISLKIGDVGGQLLCTNCFNELLFHSIPAARREK